MEKKSKKRKGIKKKLSKQSTEGEESKEWQKEDILIPSEDQKSVEVEEHPTEITEKDESAIKEIQLKELHSIVTVHETVSKQNAVREWIDKQWQLSAWGMPNPLITSEVNSYITAWRDEQEEDTLVILKECRTCLQLIEELNLALDNAPDKTTDKEIKWKEVYHSIFI
ncbi:dynein axonemal intermediate chain 7-like [Centruroides vittatus]|uniref:dynein axonemal intermediate chain 7-like n=1 Tax=Centruroides vittatus TaxID=120091 RepID=UPI003510358F